MKQVQEIIIDVMDNGDIIVETKGFKGKECVKASAAIKAALGVEVADQVKFKSTYYEKSISSGRLKIGH